MEPVWLRRDTRGKLIGLGGNQGNKVSIAPFDSKRVIATVWPKAVLVPPPVLPVLAANGAVSSSEA